MRITHLWRHPIKSHGHEALDAVELVAGQTMPWDRTWAVAHEVAKSNGSEWAHCANYSRGAKAPKLMAIDCKLNEATEQVTLSHPAKDTITLHPEQDSAALMDWVRDLMPDDRAASAAVHRVAGRGMTDTDFPSISLMNDASNTSLSNFAGMELDKRRWRGNIWFDGAEAWSELNWIGKNIQVGEAVIKIAEPIVRCPATMSNPETGVKDVDTLRLLEGQFGHKHFGIYGTVVTGGRIALGDSISIQ